MKVSRITIQRIRAFRDKSRRASIYWEIEMAEWLVLINAADNLLTDCEKNEAVTTNQTTHTPQEPINVDCELAAVEVAGDMMEQVNLINYQFQAGIPNNLRRRE